jgi:hypothetical protein
VRTESENKLTHTLIFDQSVTSVDKGRFLTTLWDNLGVYISASLMIPDNIQYTNIRIDECDAQWSIMELVA